MGTYNNSVRDIVIELADRLNSIEGDFSGNTLEKAMDKLKEYPHHTGIVSRKEEKKWYDYINGENN